MIYFDNAATTFPKPDCVYEAINVAMKKYAFNAGRGGYKEASDTFKMIENTRQKLADVIGGYKEQVIFTSSATESLNNIFYGLELKEGDNIYISPFEHNAVVRPLNSLKVNILLIPFDKKTWKLDVSKLNDMFLLKKPKAIVLSHISNVTGFELPYNEIFSYGKKYNSINILDSAQGFGVYNIDKTDCDYIVFAGHKSLYAMFGIAGYFKLSTVFQKTIKIGGTGSDSLNINMPDQLPYKYEAGSLNSIGIYSINCAIDFLKNSNFASQKLELTKYCINKLKHLDNIEVYLPDDYVSKGIISFNVLGYSSDEVGTILADEFNICVRTGFHCAPYIHDFIDSKKYNGTVRISFSAFNTNYEIDKLISVLRELK